MTHTFARLQHPCPITSFKRHPAPPTRSPSEFKAAGEKSPHSTFTTPGVSPSLQPCLRQGLLCRFSTVYTRLLSLSLSSQDSLVPASHLPNTGT